MERRGRVRVCEPREQRPAPVIIEELPEDVDPEQARLACGRVIAEALAEARAEGAR